MGDMNIYNPKAKIQIFQNFSHAEQTQMREAMLAVVAALREQIPAGANREAFEKPLAEIETEAKAKEPAGEKVGKLLGKVGNAFETVGKPIGKIVGTLKGASELAKWLGLPWPF